MSQNGYGRDGDDIGVIVRGEIIVGGVVVVVVVVIKVVIVIVVSK